MGEVGDRLEDADELRFRIIAVLVVKREPVCRAGMGMGPAELQAVMRPADRGGQGVRKTAAGEAEPRQLARHPVVTLVREGVVQIGHDLRPAALRRRIGEVEPDRAVGDLHGIDPQPVAAIEIGAVPEVELPVVPVAGEDAGLRAGAEGPFAQRKAFVRAAVVAGEDAGIRPEECDLLAGAPQDDAPLGLQLGNGHGPRPASVEIVRHHASCNPGSVRQGPVRVKPALR